MTSVFVNDTCGWTLSLSGSRHDCPVLFLLLWVYVGLDLT